MTEREILAAAFTQNADGSFRYLTDNQYRPHGRPCMDRPNHTRTANAATGARFQAQTMTTDPFDSLAAGQERPTPFSYWQAAPWNDETQAFFRRFYSHTFDDGSAIELKRRDDGAVLARGMREGKPATWTTWSSAETIRHEGLVNDYLAALRNPRAATPPREGHKLIVFHAARDSITAETSSVDRDTLLSLAASRMQKPKKGADRRRADSAPRALRELLADGVLHVVPSGRIAITYDERFNDDEGADDDQTSD